MPTELLQNAVIPEIYDRVSSGSIPVDEIGNILVASAPITEPITSTFGLDFITSGGIDCTSGVSGVDCGADIAANIHLSPEMYEAVVRQLGHLAQSIAALNNQVLIPIGVEVQQTLGKIFIETGTQVLSDGSLQKEGLTGQDLLYAALIALTLRAIWRYTTGRNNISVDETDEEEVGQERTSDEVIKQLKAIKKEQRRQRKQFKKIRRQLDEIGDTTGTIAEVVELIDYDVNDILDQSQQKQ